jgi:hypothetical protein
VSLFRAIVVKGVSLEVEALKNTVIQGWAFLAAITAACFGVGSRGDLGGVDLGYM